MHNGVYNMQKNAKMKSKRKICEATRRPQQSMQPNLCNQKNFFKQYKEISGTNLENEWPKSITTRELETLCKKKQELIKALNQGGIKG